MDSRSQQVQVPDIGTWQSLIRLYASPKVQDFSARQPPLPLRWERERERDRVEGSACPCVPHAKGRCIFLEWTGGPRANRRLHVCPGWRFSGGFAPPPISMSVSDIFRKSQPNTWRHGPCLLAVEIPTLRCMKYRTGVKC